MKLTEDQYPTNIRHLFFRRFPCQVPMIALRSFMELRERGVYAMGDERETARLNEELVDTDLTINRMFEIWRAGYPVTLTREKDTLEVFNIVTNHLRYWVSYLNLGAQVDDAPFEDLMSLDSFADSVYTHARFERSKGNIGYFNDLVTSKAGFNLNPLTQLSTKGLIYNSLLDNDQTNLFLNPELRVHEEREGFSEEIARLGGRLSQGVREAERNSVFGSVRFADERK